MVRVCISFEPDSADDARALQEMLSDEGSEVTLREMDRYPVADPMVNFLQSLI